MKVRRTTIALAALIGGGVLALPMAAQAAVPFDQAGDDDATSSVPDTIDSLDLAATRDQSVYQLTVSYDDLAKTPTTDRYVLVADQGTKGRASSLKGNFVELRTNRQGVVSVHLYDYYTSETKTTITPTTCKGLAVSADYDADTIRYTLPRSCYFGAAKPASAVVVADDALFNDQSWDPAATFSATEAGPKPDSSDDISGKWTFAAGTTPSTAQTAPKPLGAF